MTNYSERHSAGKSAENNLAVSVHYSENFQRFRDVVVLDSVIKK
jgi:hypothetical protein